MGFFLFPTVSRLALGPIQPPIQWVLGVKWLGHEADHSSPSHGVVLSKELGQLYVLPFVQNFLGLYCLLTYSVVQDSL
jgi:hypothetical protein